MGNVGPLGADISPVVWGTPAKFNGFRILASLLQQRRSTEASQSVHDVSLSPGLAGAKFTLRPPSLALSSWQHYCTALEQWVQAKLCGVEHRAPPIFGRATITLDTDPHSRC